MADNNTKMNISYSIRAIDRFSRVHDKLERQLRNVERMADRATADEEINIGADTKEAQRKITELDARMEGIERNTVDINANTRGAYRSLMNLENAVALATRDRTINIDVDGSSATSGARRVRRSINSIPRRIHVTATGNWQKFRNDIRRTADAMRDFDEVIGSIGFGFLISMLSTVGTHATVAAGGIGAIASSLVSAGLGTAGFAAVAIPSISNVVDGYNDLKDAYEAVEEASNEEERAEAIEELEALTGEYTDTQLESISAINDFSNAFSDFQSQFEPQILGMFNDSLVILMDLLHRLEPAIQGVTDTAEGLIDSLEQNIEAEDMQAFFDWVNDTAGPYLDNLTKAVGNFIVGFLNMMVAFDPLAQSFMDGFLDMSESFRDWSSTLDENQSFQDFISFVQEHTPTVLSLIGNMIDTLINFGIAAAPVATRILELADSFFEWIAGILETNQWLAQLITTVTFGYGVFRMFYLPIKVIVSLLKPLITLVRNSGEAFKKLGGIVGKATPFLKKILSWIARFIPVIGPVISIVMLLADVIFGNWEAIANFTQEVWGMMPDWITGPLESIWSGVTTVFGGIKDFIFGSTAEAAESVDTNFNQMNTSVNNTLPQMDSTTSTHFGNMDSTTSTHTGNMASTSATNLGKMDSNFNTNFSTMESTVDTSFLTMNSYAQDRLSSMYSTTSSQLGNMESDFSGKLPSMDSLVDSNFSSMDFSVEDYMDNISSTTFEDLDGMETDFSTSLSNIDTDVNTNFADMDSSISGYMSDISSTVDTELSTVGTGFSQSLTQLNKATSASFKSMAQTIKSGMNQVNQSISQGWTLAIKSTRSSTSTINSTAHTQFSAMYRGVNSYMRQANSTVRSNWNSAVSYLRSISLYSTGANVMQGFINGINSRRSGLISAVSSAANAAVRAANRRLKIHSPSRVFQQIGEYTGDGFINGIQRSEKGVEKSSGELAAKAIHTVSHTAAVVSAVGESAFESAGKAIGESFADALVDETIPAIMQVVTMVTHASSVINVLRKSISRSPCASTGYLGGKAVKSPGYNGSASEQGRSLTQRREDERPIVVEVPVYLNGRQIAKASAEDMSEVQKRRENTREKFRG